MTKGERTISATNDERQTKDDERLDDERVDNEDDDVEDDREHSDDEHYGDDHGDWASNKSVCTGVKFSGSDVPR